MQRPFFGNKACLFLLFSPLLLGQFCHFWRKVWFWHIQEWHFWKCKSRCPGPKSQFWWNPSTHHTKHVLTTIDLHPVYPYYRFKLHTTYLFLNLHNYLSMLFMYHVALRYVHSYLLHDFKNRREDCRCCHKILQRGVSCK